MIGAEDGKEEGKEETGAQGRDHRGAGRPDRDKDEIVVLSAL